MSRPMQREVSVASSQQGLTIEDAYRSRGLPDDSSSGTISESWGNSPRPIKFSAGGFCGTGVIFTARAMLAAAFVLAILGFSFLGLATYLLIRTPHKMSHLGSTVPPTAQPYLFMENFTHVSESTNGSTMASRSWNAPNATSNDNSSYGSLHFIHKITSQASTTHKPNRVLDYPHGRHSNSKARHHSESIKVDVTWPVEEPTPHNRHTTEPSTEPPKSFIKRLLDFVSLHNADS